MANTKSRKRSAPRILDAEEPVTKKHAWKIASSASGARAPETEAAWEDQVAVDKVYTELQHLEERRTCFLDLCERRIRAKAKSSNTSPALGVLYGKVAKDKEDWIGKTPAQRLRQLRKVLVYVERTLDINYHHRKRGICRYHEQFRGFEILGSLQHGQPQLVARFLRLKGMTCDKCRDEQPDESFGDFPTNHEVSEAWQLPLSADMSHRQRELDCANHVLHDAMQRCFDECSCDAKCTQGRLQLTDSMAALLRTDGVFYDTVFPDASQAALMRLRFHVSSGKVPDEVPGKKKVGFKLDDASASDQDTLEVQLPKDWQPTTLCNRLRSYLGALRIGLHATAKQLYDVSEMDREETGLTPQAGHTLAMAVATHHLSDAGKVYLAYSIAFSFWQFYTSRWMDHRWTVENIHFLQETYLHNNGWVDDLHAIKPFIQMRFDGGSGEPHPIYDAEYVEEKALHLYHAPRILALGVALVAIFWGPVPQQESPNDIARYNNEGLGCLTALQRELELDMHTVFPLKESIRSAVTACFDEKVVNKLGTIQERREYLYKHVVGPLQCFAAAMHKANFSPEAEKWQRWPTQISRLPNKQPTTEPTEKRQFGQEGSFSNTNDGQKSKDWIVNLRESQLHEEVRAMYCGRSGQQKKRTRIAILDSGYDPSYFVGNRLRDRIHWKDFVEGEPCARDCSHDLHGTAVLHIAGDILPCVEFYVARIAGHSSDLYVANPETAKCITDAIRWAAIDCEVDIISMSWGFTIELPQIAYTIEQVVKERDGRLLFFAAAGNHGKNGREDFPSNHHRVISVHSHDHDGNLSKFDTGSTHAGRDYLAVLGENIPVHPSFTKTYSGTSFSTPIAAAIAGLVLEAAKCSIAAQGEAATGEELGKYEQLRTMDGMKRMFLLEQLTPNVHHGHRNLCPLAFCSYGEQDRRTILDYAVS